MDKGFNELPPNDLTSLLEFLQTSDFVEFSLGTLLQLTDKDKKLKYNDDELEMVEEKINEMFPEGHKPLVTTIIPFGFYLGEVLRRKIPGAKWELPDENDEVMGGKKDNVMDICITFGDSEGHRMKAKPFMRVSKYWGNREDRMSAFTKLIELTSEIKMDPEYWTLRADGEGWITMANEVMFRMFSGFKKGDSSEAEGVFHKGKFGDGKYGKNK